MYKIESFTHALINILIEYHFVQTKRNVFSAKSLTEGSLEKIQYNVNMLLQETCEKYTERTYFLKFLTHVLLYTLSIQQENKRLNHKETRESIILVQDFLFTCNTLFKKGKNEKLTVKYNNTIYTMGGFKLGNFSHLTKSISKLGEILQNNLHISSAHLLRSIPVNEASQDQINLFSEHIIMEHQIYLENCYLLQQHKEKENEYRLLEETLGRIKTHYDNILIENNKLSLEIQILQEENNLLTKTSESQKEEINQQKKYNSKYFDAKSFFNQLKNKSIPEKINTIIKEHK